MTEDNDVYMLRSIMPPTPSAQTGKPHIDDTLEKPSDALRDSWTRLKWSTHATVIVPKRATLLTRQASVSSSNTLL